jgi:peroxiredoxin
VKHAPLPTLLVGLALLAGCIRSSSTQAVPAPPFDLQALTGGRISLESLKGKVVVLDFWATWCGPCIVEIPEYAELWRKNQGRGVEIIGVACESDPQEVMNVVLAHKMPYRVLISDGRIQNEYGASGLPTTFVIDKAGLVRRTFVGTTSKKFDTLQKTVDELLAAQ